MNTAEVISITPIDILDTMLGRWDEVMVRFKPSNKHITDPNCPTDFEVEYDDGVSFNRILLICNGMWVQMNRTEYQSGMFVYCSRCIDNSYADQFGVALRRFMQGKQ